MNDEWGQKMYDDMITTPQNYNRNMRQALSPMSTPESLPEPGVEVEKGEFSNYRVRLTVEISPELIAATKAQDRQVMIQVALSEAVKKAARKIIGKIAMERLRESYHTPPPPLPPAHGIHASFCGIPGCPVCNKINQQNP